MVKFIKTYWFGLFIGLILLFFLLFTTIIAVAPHADAKMRGFTPCTYQMAIKFSEQHKPTTKDVFATILSGYGCYFKVMVDGCKSFIHGQQTTPWENYFFEPELIMDEEDDDPEAAIDEDLKKANLLDEADKNIFEDDLLKENIDGQENQEK